MSEASAAVPVATNVVTPIYGQSGLDRARPASLRRNFFWAFTGNCVYAGCQWGMLMLLAKLGSPEMVGRFALGLAVTAPVIMLTNLQLRGVQAIDARREYRFGHYLALRLATTALGLFMIAGIACGYRAETALVILAAGLAKAFETLSDVVYGLLQSHERMDRIALSLILKGPLSLAALGVTISLTGSIFWGSLALAGCWGLILLAYDAPNGMRLLDAEGERFRPCWEPSALARLAWVALPLGIVMMLASLNTNIPRYFIEHAMGERALGIFAALAYLIVAGNMVVGALGQSASPRLARYYADGDVAAFKRLLGKLVALAAGIGAAGVLAALLAGRFVLALLYRPEYASHAGLFAWLMVSATVAYMTSMLGYGMTAARYFRPQLPLGALCAAVSAVACLGLVPRFGLWGAAWAGLASLLVQLAGSLAISVRVLRGRVP